MEAAERKAAEPEETVHEGPALEELIAEEPEPAAAEAEAAPSRREPRAGLARRRRRGAARDSRARREGAARRPSSSLRFHTPVHRLWTSAGSSR